MQKHVMRNIFIAFLFVVCSIYLIFAWKMPMGTLSEPDSGFLPIILGVMGVLLSIALFIASMLSKHREKLEEFTKSGIARLLGYIVVIFIFIATFKTLGYLVIFPVILGLSKLSGFQGWLKPMLFAGIFTAAVYGVFAVMLSVPLPRGIFFDY